MPENSTQIEAYALAYAMARAHGEDVAIVEFKSYLNVVPLSHVKEGDVTFIAHPLEALGFAACYTTERSARIGAKAMARLYKTPQAVWQLSDDTFIHCAETLDVGLFDCDAVRILGGEHPC